MYRYKVTWRIVNKNRPNVSIILDYVVEAYGPINAIGKTEQAALEYVLRDDADEIKRVTARRLR